MLSRRRSLRAGVTGASSSASMVTLRSFIRVAAALSRVGSSRGIDRGLPVPTVTGEMHSD